MIVRRLLLWADDRLGTAHFVRHALRKAFPDHWSFMLGEINVYAFLILLATGTFLAFFFDPSGGTTTYEGPYKLLDGAHVSHAYDSALYLSFVVNGGLLIRQIHHWTALIFLAGVITHMARIFFTGAFRKPREINWVIGIALLGLALLEGFTGYSLPDDLLSGTGLRIADAVLLSIPLIGGWASVLLLGNDGVFPTDQMLSRLFVAHIFLLPAAIAGAIAIHLIVLWRQKHSQFPGPAKTETNVVGSPLFPKYALKSMALLFATLAIVTALGALVQINPIWIWGPYQSWQASSPAQPDWYVGWLEGALRMGPAAAVHLWGRTIPSPFWPAVLMPSVLFTLLLFWPWIEAGMTGDRKRHQLLDLPRNVPARTGLGVAVFIFALGMTLAGSDDVQARYVHLSVTTVLAFYQIFCTAGPVLGFAIAYVAAKELQARDAVHKATRVRLRRNAQGGFDEEPLA